MEKKKKKKITKNQPGCPIKIMKNQNNSYKTKPAPTVHRKPKVLVWNFSTKQKKEQEREKREAYKWITMSQVAPIEWPSWNEHNTANSLINRNMRPSKFIIDISCFHSKNIMFHQIKGSYELVSSWDKHMDSLHSTRTTGITSPSVLSNFPDSITSKSSRRIT